MFHAAEPFGQNGHLFLTKPRRSPAAGLPRPEAGSGAPEGLELSPWSVFLHECCRYPGAGGGLQWTPYQRAPRSDAFTSGPVGRGRSPATLAGERLGSR